MDLILMRKTKKEDTLIQYCGSGSTWIHIIFRIVIGIRIEVKEPIGIRIELKIRIRIRTWFEVKSQVRIKINFMKLRNTAKKY